MSSPSTTAVLNNLTRISSQAFANIHGGFGLPAHVEHVLVKLDREARGANHGKRSKTFLQLLLSALPPGYFTIHTLIAHLRRLFLKDVAKSCERITQVKLKHASMQLHQRARIPPQHFPTQSYNLPSHPICTKTMEEMTSYISAAKYPTPGQDIEIDDRLLALAQVVELVTQSPYVGCRDPLHKARGVVNDLIRSLRGVDVFPSHPEAITSELVRCREALEKAEAVASCTVRFEWNSTSRRAVWELGQCIRRQCAAWKAYNDWVSVRADDVRFPRTTTTTPDERDYCVSRNLTDEAHVLDQHLTVLFNVFPNQDLANTANILRALTEPPTSYFDNMIVQSPTVATTPTDVSPSPVKKLRLELGSEDEDEPPATATTTTVMATIASNTTNNNEDEDLTFFPSDGTRYVNPKFSWKDFM